MNNFAAACRVKGCIRTWTGIQVTERSVANSSVSFYREFQKLYRFRRHMTNARDAHGTY